MKSKVFWILNFSKIKIAIFSCLLILLSIILHFLYSRFLLGLMKQIQNIQEQERPMHYFKFFLSNFDFFFELNFGT
jgi:hypothetical protein